ncbi:MAG: FHA domain-containing protein [Symploca sp. SIO2E6]|nr:FHA domain-containing protein [Symploca sp. SIO2E6]
MIVCPNCNHQNPEGATQCEACYTPLPETTTCPNCGATVQADAGFCGQCGFNLKAHASSMAATQTSSANPLPDVPDLVTPEPLIEPQPMSMTSQMPEEEQNPPSTGVPSSTSAIPTIFSKPSSSEAETQTSNPDLATTPPPPPTIASTPVPPSVEVTGPLTPPTIASTPATPPSPTPVASGGAAATQLQVQSAKLLHLQTDTLIELPQNLTVIHIGKPNDKVPPDIDVSGFPDSDIVSRVHADIRVEGDAFYLEDIGSSNGTYVNHTPLTQGNRHRLRAGDRISLGKGDQVTFLFQNT